MPNRKTLNSQLLTHEHVIKQGKQCLSQSKITGNQDPKYLKNPDFRVMLSRIEANLRSFKPAINELPERRASVLIPLLEREGQTLLLLTKRSEKLRSHSGQVSFPGGKQDEQDQSCLETALREAREEIGL